MPKRKIDFKIKEKKISPKLYLMAIKTNKNLWYLGDSISFTFEEAVEDVLKKLKEEMKITGDFNYHIFMWKSKKIEEIQSGFLDIKISKEKKGKNEIMAKIIKEKNEKLYKKHKKSFSKEEKCFLENALKGD